MPAKKTTRVKLTLHNSEAKVFTTEGPLVHGSVVSLPTEEAQRLIELGCATLTDADDVRVEPTVNIEGGTFERGEPSPEPDAG